MSWFSQSQENHWSYSAGLYRTLFGMRDVSVGGCIVMMGGPCSGKSTRAEELRHHFQEIGMRVNVVGEDQLAWDKGKLHTVSEERKILERAIRSSLEQTAMDAGSITILDTMLCSVAHSSVLRRNLTGMFHMYGWRSIVVFCDTPVLEAWQWCQAQAAQPSCAWAWQ